MLTWSALLLSGAYVGAQQRDPQTFRAAAELIQLDVLVLDDAGRPARGLRRGDFTILEDGIPQVAETFAEIELETDGAIAPPLSDVFTNQFAAEKRLVVVLLDDSRALPPFALQTARAAARGVVERLRPGDLAAVTYVTDGRLAQDFTTDRSRLLAAVEAFDARVGGSPVVALAQVTQALAQVRDRRKMVFYISPGEALSPRVFAPVFDAYLDGVGGTEGLHRTARDLQSALRAARTANVSVYAVDPLGLSTEFDEIRAYRTDFLELVSTATGGRALLNTNDPDARIDAVFDENSNYYLLGFQSTNPAKDGTFRRVEVQVRDPGLRVQARQGYYALDADTAAAAAVAVRNEAIASVVPVSDLPLHLSMTPLANPDDERESSIMFTIGLEAPIPEEPGTESVEVQVGVFDAALRRRWTGGQDVALRLRPTGATVVRYQVIERVDLPPGRYQVRVWATALERELSGSVFADLLVPEMTDAPLALSGLALEQQPAVLSVPRDELDGLIDIVPTANRRFRRSATVRGFVRVYRRDAGTNDTARVTISVHGETGRVEDSAAQDLPREAFVDDGFVDLRWTVPMSQFAPGQYTMVVEATGGGAMERRELQFIVEGG